MIWKICPEQFLESSDSEKRTIKQGVINNYWEMINYEN